MGKFTKSGYKKILPMAGAVILVPLAKAAVSRFVERRTVMDRAESDPDSRAYAPQSGGWSLAGQVLTDILSRGRGRR